MKTVLITGGSRGIGAALVRAFSAAGYSVAFTYKTSKEAALALSRECGALPIRADMECPSDIENSISTATEKLGEIDVLINNVGISSFSLLSDLTLEDWNRTMTVNLTSAFLYSKGVIPKMVNKKWGRIINITSMWGITGSSCEVHYSTSKAALIGFTKALAKELGPSGITVNAIAPGLINTDMNASLGADVIAEIADETPLMRVGEPEDVARCALFLASDGASFVTGDVLNVSGGYVI